MATRQMALCVSALLGALAFGSTQASALTMQECSAKYKAAQAAGTAKGVKWNDFRKAECGSDATAAPAAAKPAATPAATSAAAKPAATPAAAKPAATPAAAAAVFPTAVDSKYSKESAGKARMHTCLDQYNANKAKSGNGGLNWIQKGGGYYAECNKRLKG